MRTKSGFVCAVNLLDLDVVCPVTTLSVDILNVPLILVADTLDVLAKNTYAFALVSSCTIFSSSLNALAEPNVCLNICL